MNYSKQYINEIAQKSGFLANNTEKVIRLLNVLKFIDEELNRISHQLILKGGTAINLIYTNLTRLSVDIDLNTGLHMVAGHDAFSDIIFLP